MFPLNDPGLTKRRVGWGLVGSGLGLFALTPVLSAFGDDDDSNGTLADVMVITGTVAAAIVAAGIGFVIIGNQEESDVFESLPPAIGLSVSPDHVVLGITF